MRKTMLIALLIVLVCSCQDTILQSEQIEQTELLEPGGTWGNYDPRIDPKEPLIVYDSNWIQDNGGFWIRSDTAIVYCTNYTKWQPNQKLHITGSGDYLFKKE